MFELVAEGPQTPPAFVAAQSTETQAIAAENVASHPVVVAVTAAAAFST